VQIQPPTPSFRSSLRASTSASAVPYGYTITISNPNSAASTLNSITDTLPAGFTYTPGSSTGATTADPTIAASTLTWAGPIAVPPGGTAVLHFGVTVSSTPGTYTNQATADGGADTVVGTGPTALAYILPPILQKLREDHPEIELVVTTGTTQTITEQMLENVIDLGFTALPVDQEKFDVIPVREPVVCQGLRIRAIPVHHPVYSVGYILEGRNGAVAFSGDTGPTDELWRAINATPNLKAVFLELSFPNTMQWLADISLTISPTNPLASPKSISVLSM